MTLFLTYTPRPSFPPIHPLSPTHPLDSSLPPTAILSRSASRRQHLLLLTHAETVWLLLRERAPLSVYIQNTDPVSPLLALRMPFLSGLFTDRNQSFPIGEIESSSVDSLPVRGDNRQNTRPISIERDLRASSFFDLLPSLSRCDMRP